MTKDELKTKYDDIADSDLSWYDKLMAFSALVIRYKISNEISYL